MRSGLNRQFLTRVAAIAMGIACASAGAQVVNEFASLSTEPTVLTQNGVFTSCGFRFFGAAQFNDKSTSATGIDGSIMLNDHLWFLSKAGRFKISVTEGSQPSSIPGEVRWIKLGADGRFTPADDKVISGESKGYHLFGSPFNEQNFQAFAAPSGTLWIAFSGADGTNAIYAGNFSHSATTAARIDECMSSMISRVSKELEEKSPADQH